LNSSRVSSWTNS